MGSEAAANVLFSISDISFAIAIALGVMSVFLFIKLKIPSVLKELPDKNTVKRKPGYAADDIYKRDKREIKLEMIEEVMFVHTDEEII